ncbi:MAG: ImmA/IrrE family metallo-endopeptidase [Thermodesulfobacteriota bacterium]
MPRKRESQKQAPEIVQLAEHIAEELKGCPHPEYDLGEKLRWLIKQKGGEVSIAGEYGCSPDGGNSLFVYPDRTFVAYLAPYASFARDNCTLAHELGHYLLHSEFEAGPPNDDVLVFSRFSQSTLGPEADLFALNLLMPREEFEASCNRYEGDVELIAAHFEVPEGAVIARAESLHAR